jgi:phosphomevalonate kinase
MSDRIVARAPGKLFLLGEYAVLDGCPAIVAGIDRRIEVMLSRRRSGRSATVFITAGRHGSRQFRAFDPPAVDGPLRFACAAYSATARRLPAVKGHSLTIDITSDLDQVAKEKIGLGSSAAVTVGVVAAVAAASGRNPAHAETRREVLAMAVEAHRFAQGGTGSGADIAASVYGGIVLFDPRSEGLPTVARLALPADTHLLVGWSGTAASTTDLVQRYRAVTPERAPVRAAFVVAAHACIERFVGACSTPDRLLALDDYGRLLERLAEGLDLPLLTPRLRALLTIARTHGAAAKIAGAGGGDCGIALARDATSAQRIRAAWHAAGVAPLALGVSADGVTVDHG